MSASESKKHLRKGFFINLSGNISRLFRPLFIFLITRLYPIDVFAAFSVVLAFVEFLYSLALLGMEDATYKFIPERLIKGQGLKKALFTILITVITLSTALVAGFYLALPFWTRIYARNPEAKLAFLWLLPVVTTMSLSRILLAQTRALKRMEYHVFTVDFIEPLALSVFILIFYFIPATKPYGPYLAYLSATSISVILGFYFFLSRFPFEKLKSEERVGFDPEIFRYALFMGGNSLIGGGLRKIDIMLAGGFLNPALVGIYSLAVEISYTLGKIRIALNPILSPITSELHANKEKEKLRETFIHSVHLTLLFSIPVLMVFIIAGKDLLHLFDGKYVEGYIPLIILTTANFITNAMGQAFQMVAILGKPQYSLYASMYDLGIRTLLGVLLIPVLGPTGAALSTGIGISTSKIPLLLYLKRKWDIVPWNRSMLKEYIIAGALGIILYLLVYKIMGSSLYYVRFISFTIPFTTLYFLASKYAKIPGQS